MRPISVAVTSSSAAACLAVLTLTGCQAGDASEGDQPRKLEAIAEPVDLLRRGRGDDPAFAVAETYLYQSAADLPADVATIHALGVDFETEDLIVVALGEQPTAGFGVTIQQAALEGDALVVYGRSFSAPDGDSVVPQVLTYPYAYAVIPNTDSTRVYAVIE